MWSSLDAMARKKHGATTIAGATPKFLPMLGMFPLGGRAKANRATDSTFALLGLFAQARLAFALPPRAIGSLAKKKKSSGREISFRARRCRRAESR
jgi:hypothetical protein